MITTFPRISIYFVIIFLCFSCYAYAQRQNLAYKNDVEFVVFPGLNHLFIRGEVPSRPDEYMKAGNVSFEVIQTIVNWIEGIEN